MELLKEDINDPAHGWYKSLEQKEKDGYSAVIHLRPVKGKALNVGRCESITRGVTYNKSVK